ncbi:MAG: hypothetical protein AAF770_02470 [Bacteroidota bacterium]
MLYIYLRLSFYRFFSFYVLFSLFTNFSVYATDQGSHENNHDAKHEEDAVIDDQKWFQRKEDFYQLIKQWKLTLFPHQLKCHQKTIQGCLVNYLNHVLMVDAHYFILHKSPQRQDIIKTLIDGEVKRILTTILPSHDLTQLNNLTSLTSVIFFDYLLGIFRDVKYIDYQKDTIKKEVFFAWNQEINQVKKKLDNWLWILGQSKTEWLNTQIKEAQEAATHWVSSYSLQSLLAHDVDINPLLKGATLLNQLVTLEQAPEKTFTPEQKQLITDARLILDDQFEADLQIIFKKTTFFDEQSDTRFNLQQAIDMLQDPNFFIRYSQEMTNGMEALFIQQKNEKQRKLISLIRQFKIDINNFFEQALKGTILYEADLKVDHLSLRSEELDFPLGTITTFQKLYGLHRALAEWGNQLWDANYDNSLDQLSNPLRLGATIVIIEAYLYHIKEKGLVNEVDQSIQAIIEQRKFNLFLDDAQFKDFLFAVRPEEDSMIVNEDSSSLYLVYYQSKLKKGLYNRFQLQLFNENPINNYTEFVQTYPATIVAFSNYVKPLIEQLSVEEKEVVIKELNDPDWTILTTAALRDRLKSRQGHPRANHEKSSTHDGPAPNASHLDSHKTYDLINHGITSNTQEEQALLSQPDKSLNHPDNQSDTQIGVRWERYIVLTILFFAIYGVGYHFYQKWKKIVNDERIATNERVLVG